MGWSYERFWNPLFWPHTAEHPRGLASGLSPGDDLGEVTRDFIAIRKVDGHGQRFIWIVDLKPLPAIGATLTKFLLLLFL